MKRNVLIGSLLAVAGGALITQLSSSEAVARQDAGPTLVHPQASLDALAAIAEQNPDDAITRIRLGLMLEDMGRSREAQRWFLEASKIDPTLTVDLLSPPDREPPMPASGNEFPRKGPDVIVGALYDLRRWARVGDITAFSVGTESCNAGDTPVQWVSSTNEHPVIAQHLYRMKDGRFEMIGQSWVKHGFYAVNGTLCTAMFGYGCSGSDGTFLGVGCSDPYGGFLNGSYQWLGPKHEINASTGYFPMPWGSYPDNEPIGKRLQVRDHYLKPALNPGALYFIEGHYITADDAAAGNDLNNASYRRVAVVEGSPDVFTLAWVSGHSTQMERAAIYAWEDFDPTVEVNTVDVPDDGRFILGHKVTDNGDGTWSYEFALHNFNSDRSGQSFSVPVAQSVNVTDIGFHNVEWHSGAPYSEDPWTVTHEDCVLTWQTETYAENVNANALRWGTLYNFRFVADAPPDSAMIDIGLFKPGGANSPDSVQVAGVRPHTPIEGDINGDGVVDVSDLLMLLAAWGSCGAGCCPADLNEDGVVDVSDLLILLSNWG